LTVFGQNVPRGNLFETFPKTHNLTQALTNNIGCFKGPVARDP